MTNHWERWEERLTTYNRVTPEEAGPVVTDDGREIYAGEDGFLEELCRQIGATYEEEPSGSTASSDGPRRDQDPGSGA